MRLDLYIYVLIGAMITLCHGLSAQETKIPWKVDVSTARRLAAEGQFGVDKHLDSFDYDRKLNQPFFEYYGINDPPAEGGFGYFAVNPWTGDVWALWGCYRLSTPALRKSQAAIRGRFTPDELKQYTRLRHLKPECVFEN